MFQALRATEEALEAVANVTLLRAEASTTAKTDVSCHHFGKVRPSMGFAVSLNALYVSYHPAADVDVGSGASTRSSCLYKYMIS